MTLFSNSHPETEFRSAFSPDSAITDSTWDDATPPPYDVAVAHNSRSVAQDVTVVRTPNLLSPGKRKSSRATPRSYSRPFRPGIKVDTAVSRHHGSTPRQVFPSPWRTPSTPGGNGSWIRKVSQLRRSRGVRSVNQAPAEQSTPGRAISTNKRPAQLEVSKGSIDDVTPSDRAIPIAFLSSPTAFRTLQAPQPVHTTSQSSPTPAICVTPAQETSDWSTAQAPYNMLEASRPRPPSSVYSRATNWRATAVPSAESTPPLPTMPDPIPLWEKRKANPQATLQVTEKRESEYTNFEEDIKYHEQTKSADTLFEEDQTPGSAGSLKRRFANRPRGLAIDTTVPTPRRSKGWWNIVTTPFEFSRSGSRLFKSPTSAKEPQSGVPDLNEAVQRYQQQRSPLSATPISTSIYIDAVCTHPHHQCQRDTFAGPCTMLDPGSHQRNQSQQSMFSPNDRDVPLLLDGESISAAQPDHAAQRDHTAQPEHTAQSEHIAILRHAAVQPDHAAQSENVASQHSQSAATSQPIVQVHRPESLHRHQSPSSIRSETPVLETAALGMIHAPRSIQHSPNPSLSQTSHQPREQKSPKSPQLEEIPPQPKPKAFVAYVPHAQYAKTMSYVRPVTTFPVPTPYGEKNTSRTPPPPLVNEVKSVWEPEEPLHEKLKKKSGKKSNMKDPKKKKKKRRRFLCCICLILLILIILIVVLAVVLSRRHGHGSGSGSGGGSSNHGGSGSGKPPSESTTITFVNLTGFPGMPTGEMVIAQPTLLAQVNGCTNPTALWSCDLPKEDQHAGGLANPTFKLSITFNNETASNKRMLRFKRDLGGSPFTSSPSPPSEQDQIFLGNTTDRIVEPFQGEDTPFFISFSPPTDTSSSKNKVKRVVSTRTITSGTSTATANIATVIPSPAINDDGTAASANLLPSPLPSNQPLKLYNRGKPDEHFGFYSYFDRSIFLRSVSVSNTSNINTGQIPADQDGGSAEEGANARCTWAQTRFLVQIWTKTPATLLSGSTNSSAAKDGSGTADGSASPGSFPYPITITTDRHGGTAEGKMIFCYALDEQMRPVPLNKTLYLEQRGFQGTLVNPQQAFQSNQIDPKEPASKGGIDGGTGGCGCRWGNWDDTRGFSQ